MYWRMAGQNEYKTLLTSNIPSWLASDDTEKSFTVQDTPTTNFGWVILDFSDDTKSEVIRFHRRSGNTLYYYEYNREDPLKEHLAQSYCQINDLAEYFNWLSKQTNDFGFVEKTATPWLEVRVYWGRVFRSGLVDISIADDEITVGNNTTTYIYYDSINEEFGSTPTQPTVDSYIVLSKIIAISWDITSVEDFRPFMMGWWGGGWSGWWHQIENDWTLLAQRATLNFKRMKVSDDSVNLKTVAQAQWLPIKTTIDVGEIYTIEDKEQLLVSWAMTIDWTLDIDWSWELVII